MRFVVFGAGAVGGVLGGHLALSNHDVVLVGRKRQVDAVCAQNGLRMKSATGEYFASLRAVTHLTADDLQADTCVLFLPKSYDTETGIDALLRVSGAAVPLICFQNGIGNEPLMSKEFENVYGGVCRMTCSLIQPGQVSFRKTGRLVVGKYPKGVDRYIRELASHFEKAGFVVSVSKTIMQDKWLKLVVNLQSSFHAIIDERDHDSIEFAHLRVGVVREAENVLDAAGISALPCDSADDTIEEMIERLEKPRVVRHPSSVKVNNSTWQNLYLERKNIENHFFHQPIIDLGRKHAIPTPFNTVALESVDRCCQDVLGPNHYRAVNLLDDVRQRENKQ